MKFFFNSLFFFISHFRAVIPRTEISNNAERNFYKKKSVYVYYTNIPRSLKVYENTTIKYFVNNLFYKIIYLTK